MEPWFRPDQFGWLPGTLLGTAYGFWGSLTGTLALQGKGKPLVMGLLYLILASSAILLGAGITAWVVGQPWVIILLLAPVGLFGLCLGAPMALVAHSAYRIAEERSMQAKDLIGKDG